MLSTVKYPVPKAALMAPKPGAKPAPPVQKKAEEAPIFLQKTYHMIDTCDPNICSWSEDGKTFIVKNTTAFEKSVIPQFFKHNKFSSFVRQLNFYGFRKIKYSDSLRINPKLEAQTAHFWRFKHDKFMRGRKDLLVQIKRSVGGLSGAAAMNTPVQHVTPGQVASNSVKPSVNKPEDVTHLKSEVQELKQRIASMTKNIDDLTSMVKNISVKDEEAPVEQAAPGQKRKKIEAEIIDATMPDWTASMADSFPILLSEAPLPDVAPSSIMPMPASSDISDDAFVDELYEVFANEEGELLSLTSLENVSSSKSKTPNPNQPDPHLMKRIEDSLSTIPKEMHEMVADRLIDAIANTQPIAEPASNLFSNESSRNDKAEDCRDDMQENAVSLPVAVATLRTILAEYGISVECHRQCKDLEGRLAKSLPVVPMHA